MITVTAVFSVTETREAGIAVVTGLAETGAGACLENREKACIIINRQKLAARQKDKPGENDFLFEEGCPVTRRILSISKPGLSPLAARENALGFCLYFSRLYRASAYTTGAVPCHCKTPSSQAFSLSRATVLKNKRAKGLKKKRARKMVIPISVSYT